MHFTSSHLLLSLLVPTASLPPLPSPPSLQVWLQSVVDAMRAALSHEFKSIIPTYDDRPRTK